MLDKRNTNILKNMRTLLHHPVSIAQMRKLHVSLPKGAFLNISESYSCSIIKEVSKHIPDVIEMYLSLWHRIDGGDCVVFVATGAMRENHSLDYSTPFDVEDLEAACDEWRGVDGNVCHFGWI
jgi:hypothetical protein